MSKSLRNELEKEAIAKSLNERQKLFCELYCFDKDCFGNGTSSYMRAYNLQSESQRKWARNCAYQLLTNPHIKAYCNLLLDKSFSDRVVDRRHGQLISQNKNLVVSMMAISEYNKVKERVKGNDLGTVTFQWRGDNRKKPPTATGPAPKPQAGPKTPKGKFIINVKE